MLDPLPVAVAAIQGAILLVLAEGIRRGDVAAAVNALVAFAVATLPFALGVTTALAVAPGLALWLAVAGLLHAVGMLGPYDTVSWWDTVTHFVSASFVAALCYAAVLVAAPSDWWTAAATTVLLTFALGLWWELVELVARELGEEFDIEPMLVHYGPRDTLLDLVVDVLGAVAVVAVDVRAFVPVVDPLLGPDRPFLRWAVIALAVGFAALTLLLAGLRRRARGDR